MLSSYDQRGFLSQRLYHITNKNTTNFRTAANVTRTVKERFEERREKENESNVR